MFTTKKTGVTLLELMVVMSIMVIVTAASLPSFLKFTQTARLRAAARDITTALRTARRYAITKRTSYATAIYMANYSNIKNAFTFYDSSDGLELKYAPANITFTSTGGDFEEPTFSARGTVDACYTISVTDSEGRKIDITIQNITGRVKVGDIE